MSVASFSRCPTDSRRKLDSSEVQNCLFIAYYLTEAYLFSGCTEQVRHSTRFPFTRIYDCLGFFPPTYNWTNHIRLPWKELRPTWVWRSWSQWTRETTDPISWVTRCPTTGSDEPWAEYFDTSRCSYSRVGRPFSFWGYCDRRSKYSRRCHTGSKNINFNILASITQHTNLWYIHFNIFVCHEMIHCFVLDNWGLSHTQDCDCIQPRIDFDPESIRVDAVLVCGGNICSIFTIWSGNWPFTDVTRNSLRILDRWDSTRDCMWELPVCHFSRITPEWVSFRAFTPPEID